MNGLIVLLVVQALFVGLLCLVAMFVAANDEAAHDERAARLAVRRGRAAAKRTHMPPPRAVALPT